MGLFKNFKLFGCGNADTSLRVKTDSHSKSKDFSQGSPASAGGNASPRVEDSLIDFTKGCRLDVLEGNCENLDILRKGSFGSQFYRVAHDNHGLIGLKIVKSQKKLKGEAIDYGHNEIKLLSELKHDTILACYGYNLSVVGKTVEYEMAFEVHSETLSEMIKRKSNCDLRLPFLEMRKYAIDIARALEYLHSMGYVHCNLTSANIVMVSCPTPPAVGRVNALLHHFYLSSQSCADDTSFGGIVLTTRDLIDFSALAGDIGHIYTAKLSGFEITQPIGTEISCEHKLDTYAYAAPETFQRDTRVSEKYDVWSLGCIIAEMLMKQQQLEGFSKSRIRTTLIHQKFPPHHSLGPITYRSIETIARRCLVVLPTLRPSSRFVKVWLYEHWVM